MKNLHNTAKGLLTGAILSATLIAGTGSAQAALVTYTNNFTLSGSTPYSFTLNSFDSTLGALTDITLTTTTNITPQVQLINFTNATQSFTNAQSTTNFQLTVPGQVVTASASTGVISSGVVIPPPFFVTTFSGSPVSQTQTIHLASAIWNNYLGVNPLSLQAVLSNFKSSASFASGTLGVGGNGLANGAVTIAYTYNAVPTPLPAAAWLLGSGLLGLVGMRRKQK
jgi:hypothetical protein